MPPDYSYEVCEVTIQEWCKRTLIILLQLSSFTKIVGCLRRLIIICCFLDWFNAETAVFKSPFYRKPQLPKRASFFLEWRFQNLENSLPFQQIPSCWQACTGMSRFSLNSWASGDYPWIDLKSNGTVADFFVFVFSRPSSIGGRIPVPLSMFEGQQQYRKYRKNGILFTQF